MTVAIVTDIRETEYMRIPRRFYKDIYNREL